MDIIEIDIPTVIKTIQMNKARIWVRQVTLFECAILDVRLLDDDNTVHECFTFRLENDEYMDWKEDQYLIDWVRAKLLEINK